MALSDNWTKSTITALRNRGDNLANYNSFSLSRAMSAALTDLLVFRKKMVCEHLSVAKVYCLAQQLTLKNATINCLTNNPLKNAFPDWRKGAKSCPYIKQRRSNHVMLEH
jgi:hypothetical protein